MVIGSNRLLQALPFALETRALTTVSLMRAGGRQCMARRKRTMREMPQQVKTPI